ncbi:MAG: DUF262 domain-containing protein, partial [Magnetococcales bacterium]|nr:DUF262 domain-containing protein [Magnetococcales bacterium]
MTILNREEQTDQKTNWTDPEEDSSEGDISFSEYEISASPNDFNIRTLNDFIASGVVKIPGFQRNYVWDIKRASKLIESIIIGIPIPQIFLYEESGRRRSLPRRPPTPPCIRFRTRRFM